MNEEVIGVIGEHKKVADAVKDERNRRFVVMAQIYAET